MFNTDSTMLPFMITVTLMAVMFIFGMVAFLIAVQKKQTRKYKEYMEALVAEKESIMYLISLEVHDNVNQVLNVIRMNLHWLSMENRNDHKEQLATTGKLLEKVMMDTNNISHTLNTEYLKKKGLVSSLKEEVQWVNNSKGLECNAHISGTIKRFDAQAEMMIFRIIQEAMSNIIKHAGATIINIDLTFGENNFRMVVKDNGKGFKYAGNKDFGNVGMDSMNRRAKIIGSNLVVDSVLGVGTNIILEMEDVVWVEEEKKDKK